MEKIRLENTTNRRNAIPASRSFIKFNACKETGYVPLLKILTSFNNGHEDYFNGSVHINVNDFYKYNVHFRFNQHVFSFIRSARNRTQFSYFNPATVSLSMFSVLGIRGKRDFAINEIRCNNSSGAIASIVTNPVDVLALAVIKMTDIKKIEFDRRGNIEIDPSIITVLVSEDKFASPGFMTTHYNKTVRSYIVSQYNRLGLKKEKVSNEELKRYYTNPYKLESNSFTEIIKHDKKIKELVLSSLNEKLVLT